MAKRRPKLSGEAVERRLKHWARSKDFKRASVARALLLFTPESVVAFAAADLDTSLLIERETD